MQQLGYASCRRQLDSYFIAYERSSFVCGKLPYHGHLITAERSGYLHPVFHDFITVITTRATNAPPRPSHKLHLLYSVAHSITYMTAALLRSASFQFTPIHVKSLMPPPPLSVPVRWAPVTLLHNRHTTRSSGALSFSNGSQRRHAEFSLLSRHAASCVTSEQPDHDPSEDVMSPGVMSP